MVAERRTTAPCGKTITVRVSSWTEGRAFAVPREAAEYREACTTTGISMPTASLRRVEAALAGVTSCVVGAIVVPPARRDKDTRRPALALLHCLSCQRTVGI